MTCKETQIKKKGKIISEKNRHGSGKYYYK